MKQLIYIIISSVFFISCQPHPAYDLIFNTGDFIYLNQETPSFAGRELNDTLSSIFRDEFKWIVNNADVCNDYTGKTFIQLTYNTASDKITKASFLSTKYSQLDSCLIYNTICFINNIDNIKIRHNSEHPPTNEYIFVISINLNDIIRYPKNQNNSKNH